MSKTFEHFCSNKKSKLAIFAKNKMVIGGKGKCSKVFDIPEPPEGLLGCVLVVSTS